MVEPVLVAGGPLHASRVMASGDVLIVDVPAIYRRHRFVGENSQTGENLWDAEIFVDQSCEPTAELICSAIEMSLQERAEGEWL